MTILIRNLGEMHSTIDSILSNYDGDGPIRVIWPRRIKKNAQKFRRLFSGNVVYAVKCNPDPTILEALKQGGINDFDVASIGEIEFIKTWNQDSVLYFQHPVKSRSAINSAYQNHGVRHFSIDHADELNKIFEELPTNPEIVVYVRLATPELGAKEDLSNKFGANAEEASKLLKSINSRGLSPALSFHVGSQCYRPEAYRVALALVKKVMDVSEVPIRCLNLGGGFPVTYTGDPVAPLEVFMREIDAGLSSLSLDQNVELFCEPGRSLVAEGMSVVARVCLRKRNKLYINDGIFGHFLETHLHDFQPPNRAIRPGSRLSQDIESYEVFGATCDGNDVLPGKLELPNDIREGDWIEFGNMGAYSSALSSGFNGFGVEALVSLC